MKLMLKTDHQLNNAVTNFLNLKVKSWTPHRHHNEIHVHHLYH